jgi:hypothetical protein
LFYIDENILKQKNNNRMAEILFLKLTAGYAVSCDIIAEAVSRWLPTAAARVQSRVWSSGICGGQSGAGGQVFYEYFGFPCHSFHQILHPHNHPVQVQ